MGNIRRILAISVVFFCLVGQYDLVSAEESSNYYTIMLKNEKDFTSFREETQQFGIDVVYEIEEIGLIQVKATPKELALLERNPEVEKANLSIRAVKEETLPEATSLPLPSLWHLQWDMQDVTENGKSYNVYSGSKDVTVGIIDSGITPSHNDLKENLVPGSKNLVPVNGFRGEEPNETGDITAIQDLTGHGTHVAGQIAANGYMKGVAPEIGIKSYRVFGSQSADSIWIIKAIIEAANDDVDVINLSLGSYLIKGKTFSNGESSKEELAEIKAYQKAVKYAQKKGSVVVAAAGNDSLDVKDKEEMSEFIQEKLDEDGVTFKGKGFDIPAALPGVVTVSSTGPSDELSVFSNYGKGFVDIAAPGGDYRYLQEFGGEKWVSEGWMQKEQILSTAPNGAYFYSSGTSIATPKVAGALALIIDKYDYEDKPNKSIHHLYKYGIEEGSRHNKEELGNGELDLLEALSH
ncbi:peptidase S8 [Pontibacillus litoralis JSM 072002]|uniref:Leader peptide-processing serine protease n=1 Tax=Pontibacillus litoralis JSM 072002 TaxID=1385512 RepID=A0A0A5FZ46_9BACI|nr:peptidase S8 [Pontibacillus litoralis JSM 072002]